MASCVNIGAAHIVPLLENARQALTEEVYVIFKNVKILSTSLNQYFATGLKEPKLATQAIDASNAIEEKTKETVEKFPGEEGAPAAAGV